MSSQRCVQAGDEISSDPRWFPAFSIRLGDPLLSLRMIRDFERLRVPSKLLLRKSNSDRAQQDGLGQRSSVIEVRSGFPFAPASVGPLGVMVDSLDHGQFACGNFLLWEKLWHRDVRNDQRTFFADEHRAGIRQFDNSRERPPASLAAANAPTASYQVTRSVDPNVYSVPGNSIMHGRAIGPGLRKQCWRLDCELGWRTELERLENRVQNVAAEIAQLPGAVCLPAAPIERMVHANFVRSLRSNALPKIPTHLRGHWIAALWSRDMSWPTWTVRLATNGLL